uniref:Maspardin n=1 Tax=Laticauda laticaudata TaxID=8630 RepID=A0A8C5S4G2_LATLA
GVTFWSSLTPLLQIIVDDDDSKIWSLYDAGPRNIRCPLIFLPPVSGTADVFFQQILALSGWGYRVIALQYPVYWEIFEFCDGFRKLLDHLQLDKVHLFGASLGGFLAQKFAEYTHKSPRVQSLILCNSFSDTSIFNQTWTANSFWLLPAFMLKKIVLGNFSSGPVDPEMADGIDFMVDRLESLGQSELASRLTLNCQNSYVEPHKIRDVPVTIMDVSNLAIFLADRDETGLAGCWFVGISNPGGSVSTVVVPAPFPPSIGTFWNKRENFYSLQGKTLSSVIRDGKAHDGFDF